MSNCDIASTRFTNLCIFYEKARTSDMKHVKLEESLAMFLHPLARNLKFWVIKSIYIWSTERIIRHILLVLNGILKLNGELHRSPNTNSRDCINGNS